MVLTLLETRKMQNVAPFRDSIFRARQRGQNQCSADFFETKFRALSLLSPGASPIAPYRSWIDAVISNRLSRWESKPGLIEQ